VCGLAGIVDLGRREPSRELLLEMTRAIAHRGPDGEGTFAEGPVGLGARRLAILDLSSAGSQPLRGAQAVVAHNGEIYNYRELREELQELGHVFRSRTDTEVVVRAYEEWGDECVHRLRGMFAFAIYDTARRRILIARDRFGVKPLYWTWKDDLLVFASEVKAMLVHPGVRAELSHPALVEYLTFQNVLSDLTLFDGIRLLPPGCTLTLDLAGGVPVVARYWDYRAPAEPLQLDAEEASARLEELFEAAVNRQLVSDVEVGAYLSGGLDSGYISTVAAQHLPRLTTFTAGFDLTSVSGLELGFDERASAEQLSNALKTEHYEVVLHAGDMEWVLPSLVWSLEDLRVGQSYPNFYAARLASKFVKVVLSGAGGDELFGGYPWRYFSGLNGGDSFEQQYYEYWQRLVPDADRAQILRPDALRAAGDHHPLDVFRDVLAGWNGPLETPQDRVAASLYFELKTFLHGLLVVEDKLSMAHSLETRVPFLDEDLVDFALALPIEHKLRDLAHVPRMNENELRKRERYERQTHDGKILLRRTLERLVPTGVTPRSKQGFSAPDATWFRGESIDYINRLLRDKNALVYEYLEPKYVAQVLDEHVSGAVNHRLLIWSLLCLEWWCRCFLAGEGAGLAAAAATPARRLATPDR
jgi:asparagine synthase (glutamine-hydrolysing)